MSARNEPLNKSETSARARGKTFPQSEGQRTTTSPIDQRPW